MGIKHKPSIKYEAHIDGLRAISVIAVVLYHAFPGRVGGGFIGVDIFFVISGYLITSIIFKSLKNNEFSILKFYSKRIKRIFPSLIVVIIFTYLIGWIVLIPESFSLLGKHIVAASIFSSNFLLWSEQGYFDLGSSEKPLLHLWSLGVEEQFYIIWPILILLLWRNKSYIAYFLLCFIILSFSLNYILSVQNSFYFSIARFWEILVGASIAFLYIKSEKYKRIYKILSNHKYIYDLFVILGLALCVIPIIIFHESNYSALMMVLPITGALLIIISGSNSRLNKVFLSNSIAVWFGKISYSLYLWHWPILSYLYITLDAPSRELRISAVLVSILLSWITYKWVETPIRFGNYKAIPLLIIMLFISLCGLTTYYYNKDRQHEFLSQIKPYDYSHEYREGQCFLKPEQSYKNFSDCKYVPNEADKKILLWGDSYAAHLYPGIKAKFDQSILIQLTASACPPIVNYDSKDRPNCKKINEYILNKIKVENPDRIIISASWHKYDYDHLVSTLEVLKSLKVKEVTVVGQVPVWKKGLSQIIVKNYGFLKSIPERVSVNYMDKSVYEIDNQIREMAARFEFGFFSPVTELCNTEGCLSKIDDKYDTLTSFDAGHLTTSASMYLASRLF